MNVSSKVVGAIGIVIVVIVLLSTTSVIIDAVEDTLPVGLGHAGGKNESWNFTGASGAESILGLVPFVWIASILIAAAVGMFSLAKGND